MMQMNTAVKANAETARHATQLASSASAAATKALEGLSDLIARYDDPDEPYRSRVAPQFVKEHPGDYAHLARVFEWSTSGDDGEGE